MVDPVYMPSVGEIVRVAARPEAFRMRGPAVGDLVVIEEILHDWRYGYSGGTDYGPGGWIAVRLKGDHLLDRVLRVEPAPPDEEAAYRLTGRLP